MVEISFGIFIRNNRQENEINKPIIPSAVLFI
jgi:hypothetical protein